MLVVSAGIGEIIRAAFDLYFLESNIDKDAVQPLGIVSNLGIFDDSNTLTGFNSPVVNILNKDLTVAKFVEEQKYLDAEKAHPTRDNVIMMGDISEDVKMLNKVMSKTCLKIGYLNNAEKLEDTKFVDHFCEVYDIVITKDGNLNLLNALLKFIAGEEQEAKELDEAIVSLIKEVKAN